MYQLIGRKLGHSYSPGIHQAFGKYQYELKCLEPQELEEYIRNGQWQGLNVTIPYKRDVMPFLDNIHQSARAIGCVNTIVRRDGQLVGYNTDYMGFLAMADRAGIDFDGRKVLILGTGATSLTVEAAAKDRGASSIVRASRSSREGAVSYQEAHNISDIEIIVNATPVGMYPNVLEEIMDLSRFPQLRGVLDVVYNPIRTGLIQQAKDRGIPCAGGLYMLVAQAAEACRLWTGEMPDNREQIYRDLVHSRTNIVLVGMPGSGKTTVARELAQISGRPVVDIDAEIVKEKGMEIPRIFEEFGEESFRETETQVLERVCREAGYIISTGGGAPLRPENRRAIRCNSRVYLLDRALEQLDRGGRPLSANADLEQMWQARRPAYMAVSDIEADNRGDSTDCARIIWEDYIENIDY